MTDAADQEFFFRMEPEMEAAAPSEGLRKFRGTAYGGGVITDHFMWNRVVFDLETTTAPEKMPVLLDHDSSQIVGFTSPLKGSGRMGIKKKSLNQKQ
ncbi:MAG: hypothetical protein LBW85_05375 [Deltaproteobacteria bacterium]|jgi:hypothetical protein|nr:hypothetical protein [Deltaproteobacteria bacterium]